MNPGRRVKPEKMVQSKKYDSMLRPALYKRSRLQQPSSFIEGVCGRYFQVFPLGLFSAIFFHRCAQTQICCPRETLARQASLVPPVVIDDTLADRSRYRDVSNVCLSVLLWCSFSFMHYEAFGIHWSPS